MKKLLYLFVILTVLFFAGCQQEDDGDDAVVIAEPTADDLSTVENGTVVTDATTAKTMTDSAVNEVQNYISANLSSSVLSSQLGFQGLATESDSGSDSWGPEEIAGPGGGTATIQGSESWSETFTYPDEGDSPPFSVSGSAIESYNETVTLTDFAWNSTSQGEEYEIDGKVYESLNVNFSINADIDEMDSTQTEPSVYDGSLSGTIGAILSWSFTIQPASSSSTGNAVRVVIYFNINASETVNFDETDNIFSGSSDYFTELQDPSNWDITGSFKVYDADGNLAAEQDLTASDLFNYL